MSNEETYLGDAVYASFDGYQVWLRTGDGNDNRIALEPSVIDALVQYYVARVSAAKTTMAEQDSSETTTIDHILDENAALRKQVEEARKGLQFAADKIEKMALDIWPPSKVTTPELVMLTNGIRDWLRATAESPRRDEEETT